MINPDSIIYEQPLNEHVRVCLRLEHLFNQILHWMHGSSSWDSRAALQALLEILNVLDRPDLKSKLVKELDRYNEILERFSNMPHIDKGKLAAVQHEVQHTLRSLHLMQGRFAQNLRENEFLNSVRQYASNPGGGCNFEAPAYHYWLQQPVEDRTAQLTQWLTNLKTIQTAINLSLRLIRQSCAPQLQVAQTGFYQAALDAQTPCQLVRVCVAKGLHVYPEISVGRHGVSIRFLVLNLIERPAQTNDEVKFYLTTCVF